MQRKNDGKTTVPRKEFDRTPFGEHGYLILIDIKIVELATLTMYSCKLAQKLRYFTHISLQNNHKHHSSSYKRHLQE